MGISESSLLILIRELSNDPSIKCVHYSLSVLINYPNCLVGSTFWHGTYFVSGNIVGMGLPMGRVQFLFFSTHK